MLTTVLAAETQWILASIRQRETRKRRSRHPYGSPAQRRERVGVPPRSLAGVYCCPRKLREPAHTCLTKAEADALEVTLGIDRLPTWADGRLEDLYTKSGKAR